MTPTDHRTEPAGEAADADRRTYILVDGENIDATLGTSILGHRPQPEERPRWDRVLSFARREFEQDVKGLFFLQTNHEMPMAFVQALLALDYTPVPLSGSSQQKVVDIAIQKMMVELVQHEADVLLVSNDGDFLPQVRELLADEERRVGVIGFTEFANGGFGSLRDEGLEIFDLEHDVRAFNVTLPRVRIIPIDEFDPAAFL